MSGGRATQDVTNRKMNFLSAFYNRRQHNNRKIVWAVYVRGFCVQISMLPCVQTFNAIGLFLWLHYATPHSMHLTTLQPHMNNFPVVITGAEIDDEHYRVFSTISPPSDVIMGGTHREISCGVGLGLGLGLATHAP